MTHKRSWEQGNHYDPTVFHRWSKIIVQTTKQSTLSTGEVYFWQIHQILQKTKWKFLIIHRKLADRYRKWYMIHCMNKVKCTVTFRSFRKTVYVWYRRALNMLMEYFHSNQGFVSLLTFCIFIFIGRLSVYLLHWELVTFFNLRGFRYFLSEKSGFFYFFY